MDIYDKKSLWKWYLAIAGVIIIAISMVYTSYVADSLAKEERKNVEHWGLALTEVNSGEDPEFNLHGKIMAGNTTIPMILVGETGKIEGKKNFGEDLEDDDPILLAELEKMIEAEVEPIQVGAQKIYAKPSKLIQLLKYFPIVQIILIAAFIAFGYLGFSSARRGEQNRVWAGMAKETAHQLGTPISAIVGWIEHLKVMNEDSEDTQEVLKELSNDVKRLDLIADRFSKIGSDPTLVPINVYQQLEECRIYMQRRSPRKVKFDFPGLDHEPLMVHINGHLFDWVIENLLRNALDSMGGTGQISAKIYTEKQFINIDISDTGAGIPPSKFKTVFQPGYSTKKRGWGLGLSLAKRIIESYHSGRIFVNKSVLNQGTTFTIKLPRK